MIDYVIKYIFFNELYNYKLWFKEINGKCFVIIVGFFFFLYEIELNNFGLDWIILMKYNIIIK